MQETHHNAVYPASSYARKQRRRWGTPSSTPRGLRDQIAESIKKIFDGRNRFPGAHIIVTGLDQLHITVKLYGGISFHRFQQRICLEDNTYPRIGQD